MSTTSQKTKNYLPWVIWAVAACFYLYQFILRVFTNVYAEDIATSFDIFAYDLGTLSAFYYAAYATLQIPIGVLLDSLGARRLLLSSVVLVCIGLGLFAAAESLWIAKFGRFLTGAGSACGFICCVKIASVWFSEQMFPRVIGLTMLTGCIGAIMGGRPLSVLKSAYDWRMSLFFLTALGLCLVVMVYFIIKDKKEGKEAPQTEKPGILKSLKTIASDKMSWVIVSFGALTYVPMAVFGDLWGVSFIKTAFEVSEADASSAIMMLFIGLCIGAPTFTYLASFFKPRNILMMVTSAGSCLTLSILILMTQHLTFEITFALLFASGILLGGQCINFALICERHGKHLSGTATGFSNSVIMATPFLIQPLIGWTLDITWSGILSDGRPQYTLENYQAALIFVPIALALSFLSALTLTEKRQGRRANKAT